MKLFNAYEQLQKLKRNYFLKEIYESNYMPQRLPSASESTLKSYRITLDWLDKFLGRRARLSDLTNHTIAQFQQWRLQTVMAATVQRDMDVIKALWRWFYEEGLCKERPKLKGLSVPVPIPRALSHEELDRLWKAIESTTQTIKISYSPLKEVPGKIFFAAMVLVFLDTAERFSPVFTLTERDLDLENKMVTFPAEVRKGKTEPNIKPIHDRTVKALNELLSLYTNRTYRTRVFRFAAHRSTMYKQFGLIMRSAGLPQAREFKFHALRKTSATQIRAAGGNAQHHLKHASSAMTERHYIDPRHITDDKEQLLKIYRPGETG